jgi:hypothetical protein
MASIMQHRQIRNQLSKKNNRQKQKDYKHIEKEDDYMAINSNSKNAYFTS